MSKQKMSKNVRNYAIGTIIICIGAVIVIVVALAPIPKEWVLASIPFLLAGFGIQMYQHGKIAPK
ncbi:hypothetical protein ACFL1A_00680 [Patescibacteria group bacterium]